MTIRPLTASVVALVLCACGPDAGALLHSEDVDTDEVTTVTTESELTTVNRADLWSPMNEGNSWSFESTTGASRSMRMSSVVGGIAELKGLTPASMWVGVSAPSSSTLMQWDATSARWRPWLRFGFSNSTWTMGAAPCTGAHLHRSATGALVSTPAGDFADTRTIAVEQIPSTTAFCAPPTFTELTFAAGVGLVAFRTGHGERFVLKSATVAGKRLPAASTGVTASLTLDATSYISKPNTIRCITTPCPSNEETAVAKARFTVTNGSPTSVSWVFRSGCQFDVELVASSGLVVKRLSDDRPCTLSLTSVTLAPGQSRTWNADVALVDRDGLQLDGAFSARARLIPSSATVSAPFATRALVVRVQR
jgi:hypothetical protein